MFNGEQSEALLKNGYVTGSHGKLAYEGAHSLGTAFSNGTGKFNVGSSGSKSSSSSKKKSSSSSSKSSSNSPNSSSKSNSSSDSSNDKEETKETLDWIETKLDRIKHKINELDTTASSTYRTWSKRNEALSSELYKSNRKKSHYSNRHMTDILKKLNQPEKVFLRIGLIKSRMVKLTLKQSRILI